MSTLTGLDRLNQEPELSKQFKGNIGYLCHSASVDNSLKHGAVIMKELFGNRFKKIFGPQHGFVSDVQDNMIETDHFTHPYFKIPVYSLYSETRIPTDEMLDGLDHIFVDLQDVGTRIYTYIYTMTHLIESCAQKDIEIIILDRPNPIGGEVLEGNVLDLDYKSFVGRHPIPVRHALTIAELALMHKKQQWGAHGNVKVIEMKNYHRKMFFEDTRLPFVNPSPNIPNIDACFVFVGSVLLEGTMLSEGRGTTRPLELIAHPKIEAFSFLEKVNQSMIKSELEGFVLRPTTIFPMFQKHKETPCSGFFIHITNRDLFKPWKVMQILIRDFAYELGSDFKWKEPPYEYETKYAPIDYINGNAELKNWVEKNESIEELIYYEKGLEKFQALSREIYLY